MKVEIPGAAFKTLTKCSVCLEQLKDPWILPCLHFFCHTPCLGTLATNFESKCPVCRQKFQPSQLKPFYFFRNLMSIARPVADESVDNANENSIFEWNFDESWNTRTVPEVFMLPSEPTTWIQSSGSTNELMRICLDISCQGTCNLLHADDILGPYIERTVPEVFILPPAPTTWIQSSGPTYPSTSEPMRICLDISCQGTCNLLHADDILGPYVESNSNGEADDNEEPLRTETVPEIQVPSSSSSPHSPERLTMQNNPVIDTNICLNWPTCNSASCPYLDQNRCSLELNCPENNSLSNNNEESSRTRTVTEIQEQSSSSSSQHSPERLTMLNDPVGGTTTCLNWPDGSSASCPHLHQNRYCLESICPGNCNILHDIDSFGEHETSNDEAGDDELDRRLGRSDSYSETRIPTSSTTRHDADSRNICHNCHNETCCLHESRYCLHRSCPGQCHLLHHDEDDDDDGNANEEVEDETEIRFDDLSLTSQPTASDAGADRNACPNCQHQSQFCMDRSSCTGTCNMVHLIGQYETESNVNSHEEGGSSRPIAIQANSVPTTPASTSTTS